MKKMHRIFIPAVITLLCLSIGESHAQEQAFGKGATSWKQVDGPFFETCSMCHQRLGERLAEQVMEWRDSVHYRSGVFCDSCHGGDPTSTVLPISMGEAAGFVSDPSPMDTPNFCGPSCHVEAFTISEANIHTEDFEDEEWEPNCVTCHGSHDVQEVNLDLVSLEEKTCGPCHSRAFYIRQTEKQSLVEAHQLVEDLYIQLETMSDQPIKGTIRVRLDKAFKDLRSVAHYFNRAQIREAKAPIDRELAYIKGILDFSESAVLRESDE
ncbi:MAG: hypothetical protein HOH43_22300 [Candidatus Latescibacteria bacterium]|jgi:cytochrome c553|nr:hypothetical protein [Candidatus Latescibacterota bacterium]